MTLHLTPEHLNLIFNHAEDIYPEECCGILLGRIVQSEGQFGHDSVNYDPASAVDKEVVEVWKTQNTWDDHTEVEIEKVVGNEVRQSLTRSRRYWIDPREMLEAQRYGRDRQLDIIGIYHSHPDHPAMPSECDRVMAWQQYSYMIVSVQHGQAKHVLSWVLNEQNQFQSEEIHAVLPTTTSASSA